MTAATVAVKPSVPAAAAALRVQKQATFKNLHSIWANSETLVLQAQIIKKQGRFLLVNVLGVEAKVEFDKALAPEQRSLRVEVVYVDVRSESVELKWVPPVKKARR